MSEADLLLRLANHVTLRGRREDLLDATVFSVDDLFARPVGGATPHERLWDVSLHGASALLCGGTVLTLVDALAARRAGAPVGPGP